MKKKELITGVTGNLGGLLSSYLANNNEIGFI
jgi:GDP-D-mannose dehydratase